MSDLSHTSLPPHELRTIDPICDTFEQSWIAGRRRPIEDYLDSVAEDLRPVLLSELIRTELEWRFRLGETPTAEEYQRRFPACADALADWLAEARLSAEELRTAAAADTVASGEASVPGGEVTQADGGSAPQVLGEYELLEPFTPGGMGEVYRARHRRLNKLVAIKLLPRQFRTSTNMAARFRREMEAVGRLDHPNLVEAHDAGEEDGIVYLVMKLIPGDDLSGLVRTRGPLPLSEACDLIRQAALGLHELHRCGLVHRDIKPSNIRRTPEGVVKVIDLGLARWDTRPAGDEVVSEPGVVMGTFDYIAPEQVANPTTADSRADLYGLGCTLFFLLTGRAPFADRKDMVAKVRAHELEPPPDVRTVRPDVPAALADLLTRLLAKRPEDRPQTAAEVTAALEQIARQCTTTPPTLVQKEPLPSLSRPGPERRRSRWWPAATACVTAALLGLAVLLALHSRPEHEPASTPLGPKEEAVVEPVKVLALEVQHFANVEGGFDQPRGLLGKGSFAAYRDDSVAVEVQLSRPAYAYLIAFRPDGTDEVCFPEQEDEAPSLTDRPHYPSVSRGVNYGLNEGTGLQVFAVVASPRPLPAYRDWRSRRGGSPWKHTETPAGVVWWDDGARVKALTADSTAGQRGKGQTVSGKTPLVRLTGWLRQGGEVEVAAMGFAVLPRDRP